MNADVSFLSHFPSAETALASLPAPVAAWFRTHIGSPTDAQRGGFPIVARGESTLICAPTGTGKTLAAFLPLLSRPPVDGIVGLVIAPLKSLLVDQCKNVGSVRDALALPWRFGVRTGDTSATLRRSQKKTPPHVLWTTPESLAVLLTQDDFRRRAATIRWVVVDEIHALAASKRGVDLAVSLERLEELTASLQRIGLSATCEPVERLAHFLVGVGRRCRVVNVAPAPRFDLTIEPLAIANVPGVQLGFIGRLIERLRPELDAHRTTLIFANTRNVCERIGYALKKRFPDQAERIATHHSSIARERRRDIENDLKDGKLLAVVSSASLELGIDIGTVDGVVFVHPPGGVSRLLQRLGRAGHRPGVVRKGLLLCSHASEILEAGVTASAGRLHQIEPIEIPDRPLDVLCQQLVGLSIGRAWTRDEALALVRRAWPFRDLSDDDFDACLRYLRGLNVAGSPWLPHRLEVVDGRFTVTCRRMARLLGRNLGTIQSEEPRLVRTVGDPNLGDPGVLLGELDETYAKNLVPGDRFLLDGRCLTLRKTASREIVVEETPGSPLVPRWHSGFTRIPESLARRLYGFRAEAADALREGPNVLDRFLTEELGLTARAVRELAAFLGAQDALSEVPGTQSTLLEAVDRGAGFEYALHTPLHTAGNEAITRVLQHRLQRDYGGRVFSVAVTLGVLLYHEDGAFLDEPEWRRLLDPTSFASDLNERMRTGDLTRARFADIAHTALMVLRQPLGGPRKVGGRDWVERRLFDQIHEADPDFALLRQARREALTSSCDEAAATRHIDDVSRRPITLRSLTESSPFASAWLDAGEEAAHKQWHEAT